MSDHSSHTPSRTRMMPITNHIVCPDMNEPRTTLTPWRVHNTPNATNTIPTTALSHSTQRIYQSFRDTGETDQTQFVIACAARFTPGAGRRRLSPEHRPTSFHCVSG